MTQAPRRLVLLVSACLLAVVAWSASAATTEKAAALPREIVLRPGGVAVTSLTYDSRVFFDSDQDQPRPEADAVLGMLAARLKQDHPSPHVVVLGHTDAIGTDAYNLDLSRRRARTVVLALVARGIDAADLQAVAVGKRQPIAADDSEAGRARNRRVEFLISPSERAIEAVLQARPGPVSLRQSRIAAQRLQQQQPAALARAPLGAAVPY